MSRYGRKLARLAYKDEIRARRATRRALNRQRWAEMTPRQRALVIIGIVVLAVVLVVLSH